MEALPSMPRPTNCFEFTDEQFAALDEETRRALIKIYTQKDEHTAEELRFEREVVIGVDNPWPPHAQLPTDPSHPDVCKLRPMRIFHDRAAAEQLFAYGLAIQEKRLKGQREAFARMQRQRSADDTNHPGEQLP